MADHHPLSQLLHQAQRDEPLRAALRSARTEEDVVKLAAQAGIEMSSEQMRAWCDQHANEGELSDAELERAAGGFGMPGDDLFKSIRNWF